MANKWNAADYKNHSANQYKWAMELIDQANIKADDHILDIGCGDGKVTAILAQKAGKGSVVGADSSADMVKFASKHFAKKNKISFVHKNAVDLGFSSRFTLAFSNACLHWVHAQQDALNSISKALKPGGRIFFQMGGKGNAAGIFRAFGRLKKQKKWAKYFKDFTQPYFFEGPSVYKKMLKKAGFKPISVKLIPKVARYENVASLEGWIRTTWMPFTDRVPESLRDEFVQKATEAYVSMYPPDRNGTIKLGMKRLQVEAIKP